MALPLKVYCKSCVFTGDDKSAVSSVWSPWLVWLMSPNLEEADKRSKVSHENETQCFNSNRKKTLLLVLFVRASSC